MLCGVLRVDVGVFRYGIHNSLGIEHRACVRVEAVRPLCLLPQDHLVPRDAGILEHGGRFRTQ